MKHYRDKEGRFTRYPSTKKLRAFFLKFTISITSLCLFFGSYNALFAHFMPEQYNVPQVEYKALKTQELAPQGTIREVTAYNVGDISQTDDSPCISANGENICEALEKGYKRCAANFVPIGTDLIIQNYGECKVTDRMNSRYKNRVDIAMTLEEKERAINFGLQRLLVTVK